MLLRTAKNINHIFLDGDLLRTQSILTETIDANPSFKSIKIIARKLDLRQFVKLIKALGTTQNMENLELYGHQLGDRSDFVDIVERLSTREIRTTILFSLTTFTTIEKFISKIRALLSNPTNILGTPPSIDSSSSGKVCATLNACNKAKIMCGSAFVLPNLHSLNHYSASNGNIYNDPKAYSGKKEYKIAQNQNIQMQKHASETNSNWSEFSQNTLVNNLGQIDEYFTKEGSKYESQRIVNEQSITQELNALKQTPTKEFNTFEQATIHEQNATREFSAFDRPTTQEVNVSKNSITLEIGDHNQSCSKAQDVKDNSFRKAIQIPTSVMEEHSYRLLDLYKNDGSNRLDAYSLLLFCFPTNPSRTKRWLLPSPLGAARKAAR
ncbi:15608_t:CDS:2, partial [Gigaspora rosea]